MRLFNWLRDLPLFHKVLLTLLVTLSIPMGLFLLFILPLEKTNQLEALNKSSSDISNSIKQIIASSLISEDFTSVIDHCLKIVSDSPSLQYIVLTKKDGFSLIIHKKGWETQTLKNNWNPENYSGSPINSITENSFSKIPVYNQTSFFQHYGISWGFIHIGTSLQAYNQKIRKFNRNIKKIFFFCLISGILLSFFFSKQLTRPITHFCDIAEGISKGDMGIRFTPEGGKEFKHLSSSLNIMVETIQEAQTALINSRDYLENLIDFIGESLIVTDIEGCILQCNPETEILSGYSFDEISQKPVDIIFPLPHDMKLVQYFLEIREGKKRGNIETLIENKSGKKIPVLISISYIQSNQVYVVLAKDISFSVEQEKKRRVLQSAINQTDEAVVITDEEFHVLYVNPAYQLITGQNIDSVLKTRLRLDFIQDQALLFESLKMGKPWSEQITLTSEDQIEKNLVLTFSPVRDNYGQIINYVCLIRDITREQNLINQLQQKSKMDALGRLAGGIAHDFNNLLTVVIGYSHLSMEKLDINSLLYNYQSKILLTCDKATALTRQLLFFSRKNIVAIQCLDLNEILQGMEPLLRSFLDEDIILEIDHPKTPLMISGDRNQLEQILLNFTVNAKDALESKGKISIALFQEKIENNNFICFSITDNGKGIEDKYISNLFEPFFTTKESGTGLGLSISYGIVSQMKGHIEVNSQVGTGTTFKISFPEVSQEEVMNHVQISKPQSSVIKKQKHDKSQINIALVEDETRIRNMLLKFLKRDGYNVITGENGEDILEKLAISERKIHLLLTDVVMPGMNGKELAEIILEKIPDVKILFMSGYPASKIDKKGILEGEVINFIQKPFAPKELLERVQEILFEETKV